MSTVGEIPTKKGPKRSVVLDALVEPINKHPDRARTTDACKEIAANERTMSLRVSQESTVFHLLPKEDSSRSFKQAQSPALA